MKSPEINIVRKMSRETKKLLFFAPMGVIVLIICGYVLFNDEDKTKTPSNLNSDWNLPSDSEKELPSSSLKIQDEINRHRSGLEKNNNGDFFDNLDNVHSNESKNNVVAVSNKDSMYMKIQQQLKTIEKTNNKRVAPSRRPSRNTSHNVAVEHQKEDNSTSMQDINESFNDFFNTNPTVKNQNDNVKTVVTDSKINAVIHNDQNVMNNGRVKLRIIKKSTINGTVYPKNTFLYGFAKFSRNRINLNISNIDGNAVSLIAFDKQDGNKGIYIEGANLVGDVTQEGADNSIDDVETNNTTVRTIKNIIRKKNKESKVFLLNNYELILKSI